MSSGERTTTIKNALEYTTKRYKKLTAWRTERGYNPILHFRRLGQHMDWSGAGQEEPGVDPILCIPPFKWADTLPMWWIPFWTAYASGVSIYSSCTRNDIAPVIVKNWRDRNTEAWKECLEYVYDKQMEEARRAYNDDGGPQALEHYISTLAVTAREDPRYALAMLKRADRRVERMEDAIKRTDKGITGAKAMVTWDDGVLMVALESGRTSNKSGENTLASGDAQTPEDISMLTDGEDFPNGDNVEE